MKKKKIILFKWRLWCLLLCYETMFENQRSSPVSSFFSELFLVWCLLFNFYVECWIILSYGEIDQSECTVGSLLLQSYSSFIVYTFLVQKYVTKNGKIFWQISYSEPTHDFITIEIAYVSFFSPFHQKRNYCSCMCQYVHFVVFLLCLERLRQMAKNWINFYAFVSIVDFSCLPQWFYCLTEQQSNLFRRKLQLCICSNVGKMKWSQNSHLFCWKM